MRSSIPSLKIQLKQLQFNQPFLQFKKHHFFLKALQLQIIIFLLDKPETNNATAIFFSSMLNFQVYVFLSFFIFVIHSLLIFLPTSYQDQFKTLKDILLFEFFILKIIVNQFSKIVEIQNIVFEKVISLRQANLRQCVLEVFSFFPLVQFLIGEYPALLGQQIKKHFDLYLAEIKYLMSFQQFRNMKIPVIYKNFLFMGIYIFRIFESSSFLAESQQVKKLFKWNDNSLAFGNINKRIKRFVIYQQVRINSRFYYRSLCFLKQ
ncbi:unnamed protein product [Paramecium primaurelia]|uniref:Transmembrane protein n=1 Tax=Paramecium primaurelia TaxID=5886 RepID=A0A8S1M9C8_PARPR|nr:unnamed protein product [Paramecium primaurelia]